MMVGWVEDQQMASHRQVLIGAVVSPKMANLAWKVKKLVMHHGEQMQLEVVHQRPRSRALKGPREIAKKCVAHFWREGRTG